MAEPSRTSWPDWTPRPVMCCYCEQRVTLKQAHRSFFDERTKEGRIWHTVCDPPHASVSVHVGE